MATTRRAPDWPWPVSGSATRRMMLRRSASSRASGVISVPAAMVNSTPEDAFQVSSGQNLSRHEAPLLRRQRENANVFQVAVTLGVIEAVAHHELVGDLEAHVVGLDLPDPALGFIEQRGNTQRAGLALLEDAAEVVQRQAGVEDVLDQDDVQPLDTGVEVLGQAHLAGRLAALAVARDRHEIQRNFQADLADQIGEKNRGALQHTDQVHALAAEIAADLAAHLADAALDGAAPQQHLQVLLAMRGHRRSDLQTGKAGTLAQR